MNNFATMDNLNAVTAASKRSVWFAGDNGTILSWDGTNFKAFKVELSDGVRLRAIHMFSASDGWAVGYNTANYYGRIYRFDGRDWKLFTEEGIRGVKLCGLAFLGPQDGLAAGEEGHLYRWDGRTWADMTSAILFGSSVDSGRLSLVTDLAADPDKRVYVLACNYKTKISPDRTERVYVRLDLAKTPAGVSHNTPAQGGFVSSPTGRLFAVPEGKFHYLTHKTVYTFNHGSPTYGEAGIRSFAFNINQGILHGLWLFGKDDGWFVGDYGTVLRLKPGPRSQTYTPVQEKLNDIWMLDPDFGFIAGDKGTVLMRNTPAGVVLDVVADRLEYESGAQVLVAVSRVSQASTATVSLQGAAWEIKKETTRDERTSLATVYTSSLSPASRSGNLRLDPGEILTLQWNQKDSQGRLVGPGAYRAVFRVGDQAPGVRFTVRAPSGPVTSSDTPDMHGGMTLETPDVRSTGEVIFKIVNHETQAVDLTGATYAIDIKRTDGMHNFYASPERSGAFQPGSIAAGKSYVWTWKRQDSTGKQQAGDGQYQLVVIMPGKSPDRLSKAFDITTAAFERNK
ncbi:MAG: hypothetical protein NTW95_08875 [Candidatus Aminicenantes bacterium]|nr:hypothetical protein [Candidatus Aminicenantes bacterium]